MYNWYEFRFPRSTVTSCMIRMKKVLFAPFLISVKFLWTAKWSLQNRIYSNQVLFLMLSISKFQWIITECLIALRGGIKFFLFFIFLVCCFSFSSLQIIDMWLKRDTRNLQTPSVVRLCGKYWHEPDMTTKKKKKYIFISLGA